MVYCIRGQTIASGTLFVVGMHWNILDEKRRTLLPLFRTFSDAGFYLAGGTGLALQLGHRDSIDFDFFKEGDFDTTLLKKEIETVFVGRDVVFTQEEKNTLSCVIEGSVQVSFFGFLYPLQAPLIQTEYFSIASVADIGCMKLAAVTGRSVEKDYVDLYFILQTVSLADLVSLCRAKYPTLDSVLVLKSLGYFDDVLREQILFKEGHAVAFEAVKDFLQKAIGRYFIRQQ